MRLAASKTMDEDSSSVISVTHAPLEVEEILSKGN